MRILKRQSSLQGRNRVAHARAPIRECHSTINARASRCIRCSTIRINAHIPRVNRPSRGATSLRTRALQFVNVTRQSMRAPRAASGTTIRINAHIPRVNRPSKGATALRTRALQFANVTRQSMRGYRAASGTTIRINAHIPHVNRPSKGATSLRTRALQFVNVTRQSMRAPTSSLNRIRTTANRQGCAARIFRRCRSRAPQGSG